jgi:predicted transcriptional regulator
MTKQEADTIIKACKRYKINAYIRREGELYLVNFMERFEFREFKAAQLMCNALVLEYRTRKSMVEESRADYLKELNFSHHSPRRNQITNQVSWADRQKNR